MISIIVFIIELAVLAFVNLLGINEIPSVLSTTLILFFSTAFYATLQDKKYRNVRWAIFFGYLFRLMLLFFDIYGSNIYQLPGSGMDSVAYYGASVNYAISGSSNYGGAFPKFIGTLFRLFGISRLWGQFIILLFSIVAIFCADRIFTVLKVDEKKASKAMWVLCLLPNFAILSSVFLRESLITMLIAISMLEYVKWAKMGGERHFVFSLACVFIATLFHSGAIAVAVGYLLSRMIYDNHAGKLKLTLKNVLVTVLLLLISVYLINQYNDKLLGKFSHLDSIGDIADSKIRGGSSYVKYVGNSNTPTNMIIYTIPRMLFFILSPVPWMWRGLSDVIAFCFSSCFYLWTIVSVIGFLKRGEKDNRALVVTIFIIAMCAVFVFGWGVANSGTACRHRDKMVIVWAVLLGLTTRVRKQGDLV